MNKKKVLFICIAAIFAFAGCGKDEATLSDNLINENPSEIKGEYQDISASLNLAKAEDSTDDFTEDTEAISNNGEVQEEALSENEAIEESSATLLEDEGAGAIVSETENKNMRISNICGLDIDKLYVTFSTGDMTNEEILGFNDLYDGEGYSYQLECMDSLKAAGIIKLKITAVTKNKLSVDFGEVEIIDSTNIKVILSFDTSGYYMYLE